MREIDRWWKIKHNRSRERNWRKGRREKQGRKGTGVYVRQTSDDA